MPFDLFNEVEGRLEGEQVARTRTAEFRVEQTRHGEDRWIDKEVGDGQGHVELVGDLHEQLAGE